MTDNALHIKVLQNTYSGVVPSVRITSEDAGWDEAHKAWMEKKPPTDSPLWKQGIYFFYETGNAVVKKAEEKQKPDNPVAKQKHTSFFIATDKKMDLADVLRQLSLIKEFPCIVQLYNRVFPIDNEAELWALHTGLEIGWDFLLDKWEAKDKLPIREKHGEPCSNGVEATI